MADVAVLTLSEFLLARIAEDEAVATEVADLEGQFFDEAPKPDHSLYAESDGATWRPAASMGRHRLLAECAAKRRIVESRAAISLPSKEIHDEVQHQREYVWKLLALPYADHPDYRDEWTP